MNSLYHQFNFGFIEPISHKKLSITAGLSQRSVLNASTKLSSRKNRSSNRENFEASLRPMTAIATALNKTDFSEKVKRSIPYDSMILKSNFYNEDCASVKKRSPTLIKKFNFKKLYTENLVTNDNLTIKDNNQKTEVA